VMGLTGDINFTWNKNLQVNGDTVTFRQTYVLANAVPEPASVVLTVCGAFMGGAAWLFSRCRLRISAVGDPRERCCRP
jgi:hypothetical protein